MDPLYYTLLTGALGSIIASITEKKAAEVVVSFEKRLQKGGQPVNHDLQRAVHEAYLKATLFVCKSFMEECGVSRKLLKEDKPVDRPRSEAARADAVRQKLYAEIEQLSDPDYVPSAKIPKTKLKLLLTSGNMSAKEQLETLKAELKEQVIVHISEWQDNLPYCFILMIREGWERNGVQLDWFNSLCLWFAEILKNDERVRTIFQSELLAEQAVNMELFQAKLEEIGEPVREAVEHICYIRKKIDDIDGKVDNLLILYKELQNATSEQKAAIIRKIEELQQAMIQEGRTRQTSRRKFVGTMPLERLFVDREAYLDQLADYVSNENLSLIVISGHGGFGKTALAAKFCEGIEQDEYQLHLKEKLTAIRAIVYMSRNELQFFSADRLFDNLLQLLEPEVISHLQPIIRDPKLPVALKTERLLDALQGTPVLLIFDNFEVMLKESQITHEDLKVFLQTVCSAKHSLKVIITSRQEISLDDLGVRGHIRLKEGLETAHAVAFLRKLGAEIPQIEEAEDEQLTELAEKVYGVPMALRSLTGFLKDKKNRRLKIADLLADESLFEDFRKHDYKQGLWKLFQEQYDILPDDARLALQVLAVFNVPVKPVAVQYILPNLNAEAVLDDLAKDYFLVQENQDMFGLHPTVQDFAYKQIPAQISLIDQVAKFFEQWKKPKNKFFRTALHSRAADFFAELKKPQSEWKSLPDLQPHLDEIGQRMKAGQYDKATEVLLEIDFDYLQVWGHYGLMIELHEGLQGKIDSPDLKQDSAGNLGAAYAQIGKYEDAILFMEHSLEVARANKDRKSEANWLGNLGLCYAALGGLRDAVSYHKDALEINREIPYKRGEADDLGNLGSCYFDLGKTLIAVEYYQEALELYEKIPYRRGEAVQLGNIGNCYSVLGDIHCAIECYEKALKIDREIRYRRGEARHLDGLGSCYYMLGKTGLAVEFYEKALKISQDIPFRLGEAITLTNLARYYSDSGDIGRAIKFHKNALKINRKIGHRLGETVDLIGLGICYFNIEDTKNAFNKYNNALDIAKKIGYRQGEAIALGNLGNCYSDRGETALAVEFHEKALLINREIGYRQGEAIQLGSLGNRYSDRGETVRAVEFHEKALLINREIGYRQGEAIQLGSLGNRYSDRGETVRAVEFHEKALLINREIGYRQGEATALCNLGNCYYALGDTARAVEFHEKALLIDRDIGYRLGEADDLCNLGNCYYALGDTARAVEFNKRALLIHREIPYRMGEADTLCNLGNCYSVLGDTVSAIEFHKKALLIHRKIGYRKGEAADLGSLGSCYFTLDEITCAIEFYDQALVIDREIGYRQGEAIQLGNMGNCYSDLGDTERAVEFYEKALLIDREIGYRQGEAINLGNLGSCYYAFGDTASAIEFHEKALLIDQDISYRYGESLDFVSIGDALADQLQWKKAVAAYHQAISIADDISNAQAQNESRYGLALACLCTGNLSEARTVAEQAKEYNFPPNLPNVLALLGIIALRQQDSDTAKTAFSNAVREADALLSRNDRNYSVLDAKGLSLCGLALCEQNPAHVSDAAAAFAAARNITRSAGIVARVRRLFDELAKSDKDGMLLGVCTD